MKHKTEHESARNHDDDYRVRVELPLRLTPINEAEFAERSAEVLSRVDPSMPDIEPALISWLDRIERKLDHLIAQQLPPEARGIGLEDQKSLDLSGEGFRTTSREGFSVGTPMYVEFELPAVPVLLVRCLGRVEAMDPSPDDAKGTLIDIAFETIRQTDVDAVVRYTLAVQRQTICGQHTLGGRIA